MKLRLNVAEKELGEKFEVVAGGDVPVGTVMYKKAGECIVKLIATKPGVISHSTHDHGNYSGKFRVPAAFVADILNVKTGKHQKSVASDRAREFVYRVGRVKRSGLFNTSKREHCGSGIHCFATVRKAWNLV